MPFHTIAFSQSILTAGTFAAINAVPDPTVNVQSATQILIPDKYSMVFGAAPFTVANSTGSKAQLQSPSLREMWFPTLTPRQLSATLDLYPHIHEQFDNPLPLRTNEALQFYSDGGGDGATARQTGCVVFLSDTKRAPTSGLIYTMRATCAATLVAATWVNAPLTFDQSLPVAKYDVVGMRAEGVGLLAARIVFVGSSAITRPGCPGNASGNTVDLYEFRQGRLGVWGTFDSVTPPSIDFLGATGTSQVLELDLIQR